MVAPVMDDVALVDLLSLRGRRALVTGGSRGIGLACAVRLVEAGADAYTASKHALTGLTKALAIDLGPLGIRVLAVAPTTSDAPGLQEKLPELEAAGLGDVIATIGASLPLGRIGRPDDAARAVLFAASDLAAFMTGSTLFVDGGGMAL